MDNGKNNNFKMDDKNSELFIPEFLKEKEFAPFENSNGWVEPFIMDLIAFDLEIKNGRLLLLNRYPENSITPKEVFNNEPIINFENFSNILEDYFTRNENPLPVIIDDSVLTLCIFGIIKRNENKSKDSINEIEIIYEILIGDPHVKLLEHGVTGIYTVVLNNKGKFLREIIVEEETLYGSRINFEEKNYMIYFPPLNL